MEIWGLSAIGKADFLSIESFSAANVLVFKVSHYHDADRPGRIYQIEKWDIMRRHGSLSRVTCVCRLCYIYCFNHS